jgi:RimJ/RimL family protein N-acetyltransferase
MYAPACPEPLLRPAAPGDAVALVALREDHALQHLLMANPEGKTAQSAVALANAQNWISRRESVGWFRVIDAGEGGVGFVQIADIHHKNRYGWLGIALLPSCRGNGIGALAMAAAERAAVAELGLRKLLLQVRADNLNALALYDRAGWRRVGILAAHYDDGTTLHDAVIYEKALA